MGKKFSRLLLIAFPLGFIGAIANAYTLKQTGDTTLHDIGIWEGLLNGSVTSICFSGFLVFVHFKLFAVPEDLFTGPMFGSRKDGPMFGGNPAIFRQGLVTFLCLSGGGLGYLISAPIFRVETLGWGIFLLMPGIVGSGLIIALWRARKN